jgi:hypothetical protein
VQSTSSYVALRHLPAGTPVEAGVDINVVGEGLLATPLGRATNSDRDVKVRLSRGELLGEETAVGSETVALLLEVCRLELDTAASAETEHVHPRSKNSELLVGGVLCKRVCCAKRRIEGTREGLLAHAVGLLVVELVSAALGLRAAG